MFQGFKGVPRDFRGAPESFDGFQGRSRKVAGVSEDFKAVPGTFQGYPGGLKSDPRCFNGLPGHSKAFREFRGRSRELPTVKNGRMLHIFISYR